MLRTVVCPSGHPIVVGYDIMRRVLSASFVRVNVVNVQIRRPCAVLLLVVECC